MQRPFVFAGADLLVGLCRLRERELFGDRDDAVQLRPELLQPIEIHLRQVGRGDLATLDEWRQRGDREKCEIVERGSRARPDACSVDFDLRAGRRARLWLLPPGRYGRNVTAGSVSSGTSMARSCSKASRLRLTPLSACSSSASEKSTPKIFSPQSSVVLADRARLLRRPPAQAPARPDRRHRRRHGLEETAAGVHRPCAGASRSLPRFVRAVRVESVRFSYSA